MGNDTYQGWANRETWAMNLWLANDQGLYLAALEVARDAVDVYTTRCDMYGNDPTDDGASLVIGEAIVEWFDNDLRESMAGDDYMSMRFDIGSTWRVDMRKLGSGWLSDLKEGAV